MHNEVGSPALNNVTFDGNSSVGSGGGMYNETGSPALSDVTFEGNSTDEFGGGLANWDGNPTLTQVVFHSNSAVSGGGMYSYLGSLMVTHATFDANTATALGGGLHSVSNSTLINVVFYENSAAGGGAVYNFGSLVCQFTNVTFGGNTATTQGGGMGSSYSSPTLTNVIMWGNTAPTAPEIFRYKGSPAAISYSLIQGCGGSGSGWDPSLGTDGGNNVDADPWFKGDDWPDTPLAVYSSSPAINAGDNSAVPGSITTDIDGNPRIFGSDVDMGAYEYQGPPTGIEDDSESHLPTVTALKAAYPNPFNPDVTVEFDLDRSRHVEVLIYDVKGRLVKKLVDENRNRGAHRVRWEGIDDRGNQVASGIYLLLVRSEGWSDHRKLVLLK